MISEQYYQHVRVYFYNEMRYINLRFTYLLTYYKECVLRVTKAEMALTTALKIISKMVK